MAKIIKGNQDGSNGRNDTYTIPGRGTFPRKRIVSEVKEGKHPNHSIYKRDNQEYIRSKPNSSPKDNINQ